MPPPRHRPPSLRGPLRAALLAAVAAFAACSPPQQPPTPGVADVVRLTVRPEKRAEFEEFLRKTAEAARLAAPEVRWRTFAVEGDAPVYVVILRADRPEDLQPWTEVTPTRLLEQYFGPTESRRILALREASLVSSERARHFERPDLSCAD